MEEINKKELNALCDLIIAKANKIEGILGMFAMANVNNVSQDELTNSMLGLKEDAKSIKDRVIEISQKF